MTSPLVFAMSLAEWRCAGCRVYVAWGEAYCEEVDGKLVAIRCQDCFEREHVE